jgi:hypothetical protein
MSRGSKSVVKRGDSILRACVETLEDRRLLSAAILSGQTVTGTIVKTQVDTYTIQGVAGGTLMATVAETTTGSPLTPKLELHAPNGTLLTASANATGLTLTSFNLAATGTYSIVVRDNFGTGVGGYALTAGSIGTGVTPVTGGDAGPTTSGTTRSATVSVGDIDIFTIGGVAGGTLMATAAETVAGSPLTPTLELYSPTGARLTSSANAAGLTLTSFNLAATGTYTVVVRDNFGSGTGGYGLTVASIGTGIAQDPGGDAGPTTSGTTRTGSLGVGDIDLFTINGTAGGTLMATAAETVAGSPLTPTLELYSPTGARLTSSANASGLTLTSFNLAATGTYTVVVRDNFGSGTGGYGLTAGSIGTGIVPDPGGDAGPTTSGTTRTGALGVGDIDMFTINGIAGGTLMASVTETVAGSPLTPTLELYSPTGARLTSSANAAGLTLTSFNLAATGTYTVVVRDNFGSGQGGYALTVGSIGSGIVPNPGGDAGPTTSGTTRIATISTGDIDLFTINGVAGGTLMATAAETVTGSPLTPTLELYSPTGARLTSSANATGLTLTSFNLAATGMYTVVVRDNFGSGTGGYALTVGSIGTGIAQDPGGDAGFIPSGIPRHAAITTGDIDLHPFYAVVGDKLLFNVAESVIGSPLTPTLEIYSPTGARLTSSANATTLSLSVPSAASNGIYTIVVRDNFGSGTGGYTLNLTETPSPIQPTITVAASDALAVEGGTNTGRFTITRTNIRALPVTVKYVMSGVAKNGIDYTTLTGTAIIPANSASVDVVVNPNDDGLVEGIESATLTIVGGSGYIVGATKTATVSIADGATISGSVFSDTNKDGVKQAGELAIVGIKVFLDTNHNGVLDAGEQSVTTDITGKFSIKGLAAGSYRLAQVVPVGRKITTPSTKFFDIVVGVGQTAAGKVFGDAVI